MTDLASEMEALERDGWKALSDVQVVNPASDAALIADHAVATRSGQPTYEAWMVSVYARRDGNWRLLLHQQSP